MKQTKKKIKEFTLYMERDLYTHMNVIEYQLTEKLVNLR